MCFELDSLPPVPAQEFLEEQLLRYVIASRYSIHDPAAGEREHR